MRSVLSKQEIVHCLHNGWTPVLVPPLVFPNFILRSLFTIIGCRKFKNLLKDTTFIHTQMLVCKGQYSILTTFSPEKVLVGAFSEYCEYQCQYCERGALPHLLSWDQDTAAPLASQQPTVVTRRAAVPGVISSAATSIPNTARHTHAGMGQHLDIPSSYQSWPVYKCVKSR